MSNPSAGVPQESSAASKVASIDLLCDAFEGLARNTSSDKDAKSTSVDKSGHESAQSGGEDEPNPFPELVSIPKSRFLNSVRRSIRRGEDSGDEYDLIEGISHLLGMQCNFALSYLPDKLAYYCNPLAQRYYADKVMQNFRKYPRKFSEFEARRAEVSDPNISTGHLEPITINGYADGRERFPDMQISIGHLNKLKRETRRYVIALCMTKLVPESVLHDLSPEGRLALFDKKIDGLLPHVVQFAQVTLDDCPLKREVCIIAFVNDSCRFFYFKRGSVPDLGEGEYDALGYRPEGEVLTAEEIKRKCLSFSYKFSPVIRFMDESNKKEVAYSDEYKANWAAFLKWSTDLEVFPNAP